MAILFDIDKIKKLILENEELMATENFWQDPKKAQRIIQETNSKKDIVSSFEKLTVGFDDVESSLEECRDNFDEDLMMLVEEEYDSLQKSFESFETRLAAAHQNLARFHAET